MTRQNTSNSIKFYLLFFILSFTAGISQTKVDQLDELLDKYHETKKFNGSVLVADQGKIIYKKGFGMANMEWDIPNAGDTKHRLGSVTKQFTAMLILQLAAEGKIDLETPISTYLPDYPKDKADIITTHHLLTHTSGIPNYTAFPDFFAEKSQKYYTPDDFIKLFQDKDLEFTPGESFNYSNSGYFLLGVIIEKISGKNYAEMLQEKILAPLGMTDSGYGNHDQIIERRATGYEKQDASYVNSRYLDMSIPYAAGSMYSTVEDLYKWDQGLYTNTLLPKKHMELYFKKHTDAFGSMGYAYGWMVGKQPIGNTTDSIQVIIHGGGINGFNTIISRTPSDKSLIVLLNNTGGAPLNQISQSISGILKGKTYDMPKNSIVMEMQSIIAAKGLDAALSFYQANKSSEKYEVDQAEMNQLGYQLMGDKKYEDASKIFMLNMEEFPDSSNVYDSYAEALMEMGQNEEAIKNYKKSVEMNPNNQNGIEMLKKLGVNPDELTQDVVVPDEILESYVGEYQLQPGFSLTISKEGTQMKAKATGQGIVDIFPKSNDRFYLKVIEAQIQFNKADDGSIKSLTLFQAGREMEGKRLSE
jgi:CubicO group peptidase (beta-lactamase class C family)/uncharacterized protein YneR